MEPEQSQRPGSALAHEGRESTPKSLWVILSLPLVLVVLMFFVSPNFRSVQGMRSAPLGADFLQEWVGAKMFQTHEQNRLYDLEYVRSLQHDSELVGFQWPEKEYFPMVYPPFYYAAFQPFSWVSYPVASKIWAICSALAFSISGWLLYQFYSPCRRVFGFCFVLALAFVPLLNCLNMGQKSSILLLILSGSFVLLHNRRPLLSGLVFGLIVFKPHLGIVIGLTMLLKRQWWFASGALLVVGVVLVSGWLIHPQLVRDYAQVVSGMNDYVQTGGYQLADSHSLWGATQLTFSWLPQTVVKPLAGVFSLLVVVLLWRVMRGEIETDSPWFARQFAAMVIATAMLSLHFYGYDLTILLLPMLLVVASYARSEWKDRRVDRSLMMVLLGIFALAGMFNQIAIAVHLQPSVLLMAAALALIGGSRPASSRQALIG